MKNIDRKHIEQIYLTNSVPDTCRILGINAHGLYGLLKILDIKSKRERRFYQIIKTRCGHYQTRLRITKGIKPKFRWGGKVFKTIEEAKKRGQEMMAEEGGNKK